LWHLADEQDEAHGRGRASPPPPEERLVALCVSLEDDVSSTPVASASSTPLLNVAALDPLDSDLARRFNALKSRRGAETDASRSRSGSCCWQDG